MKGAARVTLRFGSEQLFGAWRCQLVQLEGKGLGRVETSTRGSSLGPFGVEVRSGAVAQSAQGSGQSPGP